MRLKLIIIALLAPIGAFAQPVVTVVERERIFLPELSIPVPTSHRLNLTVVSVQGTGWTRDQAIAPLREAAEILGQCGVAVGAVERAVLSTPPRFLDFSTAVARELARLHFTARPAVYLVRDTLNTPAFDAEAIGRGNSRSRPELAGTVWITAANAGTRDAGKVFAHELAHVLMDSGEHSDDPANLMHERTDAGGTALSAAQCARMRGTGSGNGLLIRADAGPAPRRSGQR